MRYDKDESRALPAGAYRDPADYLEAQQERSCLGCKHLGNLFGKDFCIKQRKSLFKCKHFVLKVTEVKK